MVVRAHEVPIVVVANDKFGNLMDLSDTAFMFQCETGCHAAKLEPPGGVVMRNGQGAVVLSMPEPYTVTMQLVGANSYWQRRISDGNVEMQSFTFTFEAIPLLLTHQSTPAVDRPAKEYCTTRHGRPE